MPNHAHDEQDETIEVKQGTLGYTVMTTPTPLPV